LILSIVTPVRAAVQTEVDCVTLPGAEGELGVLPGHECLLAPLRRGVLRYAKGSQESQLTIAGGFVEITHQHVTVLADAIETTGAEGAAS
jgi:F-type H+-transporting ATPase subunit epsilon